MRLISQNNWNAFEIITFWNKNSGYIWTSGHFLSNFHFGEKLSKMVMPDEEELGLERQG